MVANSDGTAGAIGLDSGGNARVAARKGNKGTTMWTITTTPTRVVVADPKRISVLITVNSGSTVQAAESNAVSASFGQSIAAGQQITDTDSIDEWWLVCATGTAAVAVTVV